MNAREMHYDFKQKLNKIDSQKYRNLLVPEIDWKLNEAQEVFVKIIAEPRLADGLGFESNERSIDDIRTIVIDQIFSNGIVPTVFDNLSYIATLPEDYWFLLSTNIYGTKGNCTNILLYDSKERQHDDKYEVSPFDKSSFEWRVSNYRFNSQGLRCFTDGTFSITKVALSYLKRPRMIQNSQDYQGGTYTTLTGQVLTGFQSCELSEGTHREIVDLAVAITAGDLSLPDFRMKQAKLSLTR